MIYPTYDSNGFGGMIVMSKRKRIITISIVVMMSLFALAAVGMQWDPSASLRGKFDAYWDTRHGRYKLLVFGLPAVWRPAAAALVHERHHEASVVAVSGCIVTPRLEDYVHGYNDYMEKAAVHHFGRDVFDEAFADAEAEYERKHPRVAKSH
jgi:hypothetical protein